MQDHPDIAQLRGDAYENLLSIARLIMWRSRRSWALREAWTAIPTRAYLMKRTGLSKTTVKHWLRWLRKRGLLSIVTLGSLREMRPATAKGVYDDGADRLASEYLLTVPAVLEPQEAVEARRRLAAQAHARLLGIPGLKVVQDASAGGAESPAGGPAAVAGTLVLPTRLPLAEGLSQGITRALRTAHLEVVPDPGAPAPVELNRPPVGLPTEGGKTTNPRAELSPRNAGARGSEDGSQDRSEAVWAWPLTATPGTKIDMLAAANRLRQQSPILRQKSARCLRSELRRLFRRGWSPADVLHGLDEIPTGEAWSYTEPPRNVIGWLRYRLSFWHHPDGTPMAPPSELRAARRQVARDNQLAQRAEAAAAAANALDQQQATAAAAAARAQLAETSPAAAAKMRAAEQEKARKAALAEKDRVRRNQLDFVNHDTSDATTGEAFTAEQDAQRAQQAERFFRDLEARHALPETAPAAREPEEVLADELATRAQTDDAPPAGDVDAERAWLIAMMARNVPQSPPATA